MFWFVLKLDNFLLTPSSDKSVKTFWNTSIISNLLCLFFWSYIGASLPHKRSLARRKSVGSHFGSWSKIVSATAATHGSRSSLLFCCTTQVSSVKEKLAVIRALKVELVTHILTHDLQLTWNIIMYGMMYSHDKMMMNSKPLGPTISGTNCFTGRYSPTYRVPEQMRDPMRRCMTNPPVSHLTFKLG